jgi:crotonobetainyl-CoA:carnitine CoA-transferase CaiB-like acyl-CoA transferase
VTDGPLPDIRVLDLSRVLAGPFAGQILGDLGAEVIKVERPGRGDETRGWGPPWFPAADADPAERQAAYFLAANRNKRSVAVDIATAEGQRIVRDLAAQSDVVLENFKVGGLARYGLDHASLSADNPGLITCSITGFGQDGPYAHRPGYDFLVQAMGGLMSVTGEPDGPPQKVGVALADVMTALYAVIGIQAALAHRERTGAGQHIDLALMDVQAATIVNQAMNYLVSGTPPTRMGNAHPNIVPYQAFRAADDYFILTVGNDDQFRRLCEVLGRPDLADDARFATNAARVENREVLVPILAGILAEGSAAHWLSRLDAAGIPCGPINSIDKVFADPQMRHRGMAASVPDASGRDVPTVGSPLTMTETPATLRTAPPALGEHTAQVLRDVLGYDAATIDRLQVDGVVAANDTSEGRA